jgi:ribose transport system substrate-binding protein
MRQFFLVAGLALMASVPGCIGSASNDGEEKPKVAFVTNGIASFWDVAKKGAEDAGKDLDVEVMVKMPSEGVIDQKEILEDLLVLGVNGIAVSPIDPKNQTSFLNKVGKNTNFITHDSDAPESNRLCYIGMDNYDAGRLCGQLVKEAIPNGGEVMIYVGRLEQDNAKLRRQGVIDELLDREREEGRFDPQDEVIKGDKYTILGTKTDQFDFVKAKEEAQDTIVNNPDLACMVGLFAYNPPLLLSAAKDAGKLDEIKIVGFDEDEATLQGIVDGEIYGTVVQNPYQYGYQSVELLTALARGDRSKIPEDKSIYIPARQIRKDNVIEFWTELNQLLDKEPPKQKTDQSEKPAE